jgi:proteasome accessory factor A
MNRIVGLETEYGCLTSDFPGCPSAITRVRDWIFKDQRFGLIDVHQRDWDEPAGNGGFLFNGGRCYIDMGHLEYCTPECMDLLDVLRYDQAGDVILMHALKAMRLEREINFIRNNIDHYMGSTFGCHENYLVRRAAPLSEANVHSPGWRNDGGGISRRIGAARLREYFPDEPAG